MSGPLYIFSGSFLILNSRPSIGSLRYIALTIIRDLFDLTVSNFRFRFHNIEEGDLIELYLSESDKEYAEAENVSAIGRN